MCCLSSLSSSKAALKSGILNFPVSLSTNCFGIFSWNWRSCSFSFVGSMTARKPENFTIIGEEFFLFFFFVSVCFPPPALVLKLAASTPLMVKAFFIFFLASLSEVRVCLMHYTIIVHSWRLLGDWSRSRLWPKNRAKQKKSRKRKKRSTQQRKFLTLESPLENRKVKMAKSTNHTAHNQSYKAHRNGKRLKSRKSFSRRVVASRSLITRNTFLWGEERLNFALRLIRDFGIIGALPK